MDQLRTWVGILIAFGTAGCAGPTCESACDKSFNTCNYVGFGDTSSIDAQIQACVNACSGDMHSEKSEPRAVGWVSCVEEFQCNPADEGLKLCTTCSAGYYNGYNSDKACVYERPLP